MTRLAFFIEQVAYGLYFLCAIGLLYSFRSFLKSRHKLWAAEFELEREFARRQEANAITWTLGIFEIMLAIYAIATVVAPTLRSDVITVNPIGPNPLDNQPFVTLTPGGDGSDAADGTPAGSIDSMFLTVTAQVAAGEGGIQLLITPTTATTPVGTIIPGAPTPMGCNSADASLQVPANGQVVFDSLTVMGTANTANFASYKFELSGPSTGNSFAPFGGIKTSPVPELGILGQLSLNGFQPGNYLFRLAVFDNTTALKASCTVTISLRDRPPTATPPGT
jgi:hypothetical protein